MFKTPEDRFTMIFNADNSGKIESYDVNEKVWVENKFKYTLTDSKVVLQYEEDDLEDKPYNYKIDSQILNMSLKMSNHNSSIEYDIRIRYK